MDVLKKTLNEIVNFNPADKRSVIILAILMCILTRHCIHAIYTTSIEEIFMNKNKKLVMDVFKLLTMLAVFICINIVLTTHSFFAIIEFGVCLICYCLYLRDCKKEKKINIILEKNNKAFHKLQIYYKEKQTKQILMVILFFMPIMVIVWKAIYSDIPLFTCLVIVSVIEALVIGILLPELFVTKAMNYFENEHEKMFVFKRLQNNMLICGDNESISKSKKYIVISIDELKTKPIYHLQSEFITKEEKKLCVEN
ncbi:MAG: hypothetical protein DBX40_03610 [Clostridiales bacterium]|nr:MAG: hypothetical protein DBX40_03610 [Clostridiales bacterium]